jgi:prolyl-tRNA synthetase
MVHSDNRGLVLPPKVAPVQVVIIPIAQKKEGVLEKANELFDKIKSSGIRVELDDSTENSTGWKFNQYEMKGYPIRIEIGPRDIENNQAVAVRRDKLEKEVISLDNIEETLNKMLDDMQKDLFEKAKAHREANTYVVTDYEQYKKDLPNKPGFAKMMWCGERACEDKLKEETGASIRCMPFEQEQLGDVCHICGKEAKTMIYAARAY